MINGLNTPRFQREVYSACNAASQFGQSGLVLACSKVVGSSSELTNCEINVCSPPGIDSTPLGDPCSSGKVSFVHAARMFAGFVRLVFGVEVWVCVFLFFGVGRGS